MFRSLVLSACLGLSQGTPPATSEDPLAELVKKTNALEGFTASYRITDREGVTGHATLYYAAPDRARLSIEHNGNTVGVWITGEECIFDIDTDAHRYSRVRWKDGTELERVVDADLRAMFPGAPRSTLSPLGPGPSFKWDWFPAEGREPPSREVLLEFESNRSHLCGWLESVQRRSSSSRETDDELVWTMTASESEVRISRSTGFITVSKSTDPKSKGEDVLERLDLVPPGDETFKAPKAIPQGAQDDSVETEQSMHEQSYLTARASIWLDLPNWIDDGQVKWDEHSPEKLTRVFRTLHGARFGASVKDKLKQKREQIDSTAQQLAARVRTLEPNDEPGLTSLIAERDRALTAFREQLRKQMEYHFEKLRAPDSVPADAPRRTEFLECERLALHAEFILQVTDPMLAYFRERTDAALGR